jgi:4'-phosphopantetheinyl transferase
MSPSVDDFPGSGNAAARPQSLPSPAPGVLLWRLSLERPEREIAEWRAWLAPDEVARMRRFGTLALAYRYVAGRAQVRALLAERLGMRPADVALRRGARGRPELAGGAALDFNLSHTLGTGIFGCTANPGQRIGVDVEHGERTINADGIARKFMAQGERAALAALATADERRRAVLSLWTYKEAMSKATGDALSAPFREIALEPAPVPRLVSGPEPYTPDRWTLHAIPMSGGFIAAVALYRPVSAARNAA